MQALASYIMRGRVPAALVTVGGALLAMLFMPLSAPFLWVSGAAVGLVALRHGAHEALLVTVIATAVAGAIAWPLTGGPQLAIALALAVWLPVWLAALVLYQTVSLPSALQMAALVAALFVAAVHLLVPDPAAWWSEVLHNLQGQLGEDAAPLFEHADEAARLMTGMLAAVMLINIGASLLLARWWQARLYNPGGFREEFHGLRLGQPMALLGLGLIAVGALMPGWLGSFALDLLWVLGLLFLVQGVAVVHGLAGARGLHVGWLVGLYAVLLFTFPMGAVVLALLGVGDTWLNLRALVASKA
ncbi:hypothetical protein HUS23_13255 [Ectothiorhodospiraceae bacterium 2226]|nr:hypothetical protein HUS23_13255 [Ectothiorhodospiraceae bacterium 2226]